MYDPLWECKDGTVMKVGHMTDEHLLRCIQKINKSANWRKGWLPRLMLELEIRAYGGHSYMGQD